MDRMLLIPCGKMRVYISHTDTDIYICRLQPHYIEEIIVTKEKSAIQQVVNYRQLILIK
jgi:hypothetical protein